MPARVLRNERLIASGEGEGKLRTGHSHAADVPWAACRPPYRCCWLLLMLAAAAAVDPSVHPAPRAR